MKKYNTFIFNFLIYLRKQPENMRTGQSLMNFIYLFDEEEYKKISYGYYNDIEKNIDCFYVDEFILYTLEHLQKIWKDQ